jgi:replicative DNA helicase
VVVVDYLQLLTSHMQVENRQQEVAGFSRSLKLAAQQWSVPVIALSQLRRGQAGQKKQEPTLHDLRESGQIANDADVVLLLHRKPVKAAADELKVIVGKNRQGQTGEASLVFQGQFARVLSKYQATEQIDFEQRSRA